MSFVRNLLDETIQKEMSEEVKDFEANVSNSLNLYKEAHREMGQHVTAHVHVFRHIIFV